MRACLRLAALAGALAAATAAPLDTTLLPVGVLLRPELIPLSVPGGEVKAGKRYTVTGLPPGSTCEVRVSHPSTIPALVSISVEQGADGPVAQPSGRGASARRARSLLDTTRAGLAVGHTGASLTVRLTVNATSRGFYPPGSAGPPPDLPVAITVVRLVAGVLPADVGPVVAMCTVLLAAVLAGVPWWSEVGVRRVAAWLDGGEDADKAR